MLCRYGLFLTSLALSILFSEGWLGPLSCLLTLILPPEIRAFGLSVWSAGSNIIMPAGNVLFGIYLTVRCLVMPASCYQPGGCPAVHVSLYSISQGAERWQDIVSAGARLTPELQPYVCLNALGIGQLPAMNALH